MTDQDQDPSQSLGWRAGIADEYKNHDFVKDTMTSTEFVKKAIGVLDERDGLNAKLQNAIFKPAEGATDEERQAYLTSLGVPESPDKYEFDRPQLPDGMTYNEPLEQWFRIEAHKAGISVDQAKSLYAGFNQFSMKFLEQLEIERKSILENGMKTLKESWGNKYDENVAIVKRVQDKVASSDAMKQWLTNHNAENDPALIQLFFDIAPSFLDDFAPKGRPSGDIDQQAKDFYKT